jgi:hypothetical protein
MKTTWIERAVDVCSDKDVEVMAALELQELRAELARLQEIEKVAATVCGRYANPNNWRSVNGLMVYQTMSHPWADATVVMNIIERKE